MKGLEVGGWRLKGQGLGHNLIDYYSLLNMLINSLLRYLDSSVNINFLFNR